MKTMTYDGRQVDYLLLGYIPCNLNRVVVQYQLVLRRTLCNNPEHFVYSLKKGKHEQNDLSQSFIWWNLSNNINFRIYYFSIFIGSHSFLAHMDK